RRLEEHGLHPAAAVVFSPDGKLLATVGSDRFLCLLDAHSYRVLHRMELRGDPVWPNDHFAAFAPDNKTLVTGDEDGAFAIWDVQTGALRGRVNGHRGAVTRATFSGDGKWLVSAGDDGTALVW